jgi:hypothetical protein
MHPFICSPPFFHTTCKAGPGGKMVVDPSDASRSRSASKRHLMVRTHGPSSKHGQSRPGSSLLEQDGKLRRSIPLSRLGSRSVSATGVGVLDPDPDSPDESSITLSAMQASHGSMDRSGLCKSATNHNTVLVLLTRNRLVFNVT